jgi:dolichol-phosphate mannosyltransferase
LLTPTLNGILQSTAISDRCVSPLSVVIPVFNEGANFGRLWQGLSAVDAAFRAFVVYDFDGDDTVPVVRRIQETGERRLRLLKNSVGRGVVGAIRSGFQQVDSGPVLVLMADLSDDLNDLARMLELYREGYDVVVGSRYMPGGRIIGGPLLKKSLSRAAGVSLHYLRGIPTHDATNAFKLYDAEMLKTMVLESTQGFSLNLEITVKAFLAGYPIAEVPTTWTDRTSGESRFRLWKWLPAYLRWYFHAFRPRFAVAEVEATSG